jgi:hypothetical protein
MLSIPVVLVALPLDNTVHCDRCKKEVEGFIDEAGGMSAGVYVDWMDFFNPGEHIVCDACMWADPRYIAIYGVHK